MKLTIIAMTMPYPPTDGGRIDVWRRIKGLSDLGVKIQLICWDHEQPSQENLAVIEKYVESFYLIKYQNTPKFLLRRAIDLISYPLEVTSRFVRGKDWIDLFDTVRTFEPDVILSDHVHCGLVVSQLSHLLEVPMIVRSHDIEHLHYRYYFKCAKGFKKVLRFFSLNHLETYEKSILKQSLAFYDISKDDLQFWKEQGIDNGYFLPPIIEFPKFDASESTNEKDGSISTESIYDVVFLGNLNADNNVAGVTWFITDVIPRLQKSKPNIKILISGSNPVQSINYLCEQTDGVTLKANPISSTKVYKSGRVLVDPVSLGSGVSIKSIDMLAMGQPIVSTPKGVRGLPDEVKCYFRVAENPQSFADEILNLLDSNSYEKPDKELLSHFFGERALQNFIFHLNTVISSNK